MNLISLADWPRERIEEVIKLGLSMKKEPAAYARALEGRILLMIFQRPSLRTRVSFEVAMLQMGGHALHYDVASSPWGIGKESAADLARTASRYVDAILARLASPADLREIAEHSRVPVINGLTHAEHPCQALGDLMTILEKKGRYRGVKLAYVGDGNNNVTHSLMDACAKLGVDITVGCPRSAEYEPVVEVIERARRFVQEGRGTLSIVHDAEAAVKNADIVYTDTWMSYHIAPEMRAAREKALGPFRVTPSLMRAARPDALFMHCLPAQREVEMTTGVIDGLQSIVFDQAENRLHSEKAILLRLLGREP